MSDPLCQAALLYLTVMNRVIASLVSYLQSVESAFHFDDCDSVLRGGFEGVDGRWQFLAFQDTAGRFAMASQIPLNAPSSRHADCAELFARINAELALGHFDLDYHGGELTYRTAVPLSPKGRVSPDLIGDVVRAHYVIVDRFLPAISAVLFAGVPPRDAFVMAGQHPLPINQRQGLSLN